MIKNRLGTMHRLIVLAVLVALVTNGLPAEAMAEEIAQLADHQERVCKEQTTNDVERFVVRFDSNVSSEDAHPAEGHMDDLGIAINDEKWSLPSVSFERKGFRFLGWSLTKDGAMEEQAELKRMGKDATSSRLIHDAASFQNMTLCRSDEEEEENEEEEEKDEVDLTLAVRDGVVVLYAQWGPEGQESSQEEDVPKEDAQEEDSQAKNPNEEDDKRDENENVEVDSGKEEDLADSLAQESPGDPEPSPQEEEKTAEDGDAQGVDGEDRDEGESGPVAAQSAITDAESEDESMAAVDPEDLRDELEVRKITLDPNGLAVDPVRMEVLEDQAFVPACPFEWSRHKFMGWTLTRSGEGVALVPGEDLPHGNLTLYAQWTRVGPSGEVEGLDFSTCRLVVGAKDEPRFGTVLSRHDDVYLLEFEDVIQTAWAYVDHREEVDFIAPDIVVGAASSAASGSLANEGLEPLVGALGFGSSAFEGVDVFASNEVCDSSGPTADLSSIDHVSRVGGQVIALVDTGVTGYEHNVVGRVSVIGNTWLDDNGHGNAMIDAMTKVDPQTQVVSIKVLDSAGRGTASSVYAGIERAIGMGVKVINLSLCAQAIEGNEVVERAIQDAYAAGIIVVGAAGNEAHDAKWYVPGRMGEEAVIVGACDSQGARLPSSNYGKTVDLYVPSSSTSDAAAKVSAWLCANGSFHTVDADLASREASLALGCVREVEVAGDERPTSEGVSDFASAWTHPTIRFQHYWGSTYGWATDAKVDTYPALQYYNDNTSQANYSTVGTRAGVNTADWAHHLQAIKLSVSDKGSSDGSISYMGHVQGTGDTAWISAGTQCGTIGKRMEAFKIKLSGSLAAQYVLEYRCWSCGDIENGHGVYDQTVISNTDDMGWAGLIGQTNHITSASVLLKARSFKVVEQYRLQNADGSWGDWTNIVNENYTTGSTVPSWSRAANTTYEGASIDAFTVTEAKTTRVSVHRKTYNVEFDANGGTGTMGNQSFYRGQSKALSANAFTRQNYKFAGWNTKANGSGTSYSNKEVVTNLATGGGSATLYAQWDPKVYTISLDNQLATSAGSTAVYEKYATGVYLESACTHAMTTSETRITRPVKKGFTFCGYYTEVNGGGTQMINTAGYRRVAFTNTRFTGNTTLYARWIANAYTIRFDGNGATGTMEDQVVNPDEGTALRANQFSKSGHSFMGWSLDSVPLEVKDLSSGTYWAKSRQVSVAYEGSTGKNTVTFATQENTIENLRSLQPLRVIPKRTYTLSLKYRTVNAFALASGSDWFGLSVHSSQQNDGEPFDVLAHVSFSTSAMARESVASVTFTVPTNANMVLLSLNGSSIADNRTATFEISDIKITSSYKYSDKEVVRDLSRDGTVVMKANWQACDYSVRFENLNELAPDAQMPEAVGVGFGETFNLPEADDSGDWEFVGWEIQDGPHAAESYAAGDAVTNLSTQAGGVVRVAALWRLRAVNLDARVELLRNGVLQPFDEGVFEFLVGADNAAPILATATNDADGAVALRVEGLALCSGSSAGFVVSQVPGDDSTVIYDEEAAFASVQVGGTAASPSLAVLYAKPRGQQLGDEPCTFVNRINVQTTVRFDANCSDATGQMEDVVVNWGDALVFPSCGFSRELFDFVGWNAEPDGLGEWFYEGYVVPDSSEVLAMGDTTVFYAQWEAKQLRVEVPVAIHYVADVQGNLSGPTNDVVGVQNVGEVCVEIDGLRAEAFHPWVLVEQGMIELANEFWLSMTLGDDATKYDFARLDGKEAHYAWLGLQDELCLNNLQGEAGSADVASQNVGCLHWHFSAVKESQMT